MAIRIYTAAEVHAALPWPALVEQLHAAFRAGADVPARHAHTLSAQDTLLLMPAWSPRLLLVGCGRLAAARHPPGPGGRLQAPLREVDDASVALARVVVDTYAGALAEAGDLAQPLDRGVITRSHIAADLAELLRGERAGRQSADEITLFKSVGTALEDLAAAELVLQR